MNLRRWLLVVALLPSAATAQRALQEDGGEGIIKPIMSYPVNNPDAIGQAMWSSIRQQSRREEGCRQNGCLVIVNDTASYWLRGFYVRPVKPRSADDWGDNQLDRDLRTKEMAVRFKLTDQRFCDWPVRFVLREPATKELIPIEANVSLCATPLHNTVFRVRFVRPEVQVEPAGS